jgi:hypothetical protein
MKLLSEKIGSNRTNKKAFAPHENIMFSWDKSLSFCGTTQIDEINHPLIRIPSYAPHW